MKKLFLCVAAGIAALLVETAFAATFYVDPAAAPGGVGSSVKPFATLAAARDSRCRARTATRA